METILKVLDATRDGDAMEVNYVVTRGDVQLGKIEATYYLWEESVYVDCNIQDVNLKLIFDGKPLLGWVKPEVFKEFVKSYDLPTGWLDEVYSEVIYHWQLRGSKDVYLVGTMDNWTVSNDVSLGRLEMNRSQYHYFQEASGISREAFIGIEIDIPVEA